MPSPPLDHMPSILDRMPSHCRRRPHVLSLLSVATTCPHLFSTVGTFVLSLTLKRMFSTSSRSHALRPRLHVLSPSPSPPPLSPAPHYPLLALTRARLICVSINTHTLPHAFPRASHVPPRVPHTLLARMCTNLHINIHPYTHKPSTES